MGKQRAGLRFAKRSSSLRSASSPRSARCSCGRWSHFGPPTAPNRIAWALRARSSVEAGSGVPVASIALPPISPCSNSKPSPVALATDCNTRTASTVTSWPMPSPGKTAIRNVVIAAFLGTDFLGPLRGVHYAVERIEVGARARLDDVGRRALARHDGAVEVALHGDFADRVLARRGGPDRIIAELALHAGDGVDGVQHGIDRAVAHARVLEELAVLSQPDRRRRHHAGPADDVQV